MEGFGTEREGRWEDNLGLCNNDLWVGSYCRNGFGGHWANSVDKEGQRGQLGGWKRRI